MNLRKRLRTPRYRRFVYLCFVLTGAALCLLPRRAVFLLFVLCEVGKIPGRRRLYQAYLPCVTSFLAKEPDFRFSSDLSLRFKSPSVRVLYGIGAYRELANLVDRFGLSITVSIRHALVRAMFELGDFEQARVVALGADKNELSSIGDLAFHKAMLDVIAGDEAAALDALHWVIPGSIHLLRPHQNIAARTSIKYVPNSFDFLCGSPGRLFDLCNFSGQRVTHVGRGELGIGLFQRALEAQSRLRNMPSPLLSSELEAVLQHADVSFDELHVIPEEWTTQIGHLGMLDILFRMRELGWWSGRAVIIVRPQLVANEAFFKLFESFGKVLVIGETISERIAEELLSLQRWCGMNFNAFRFADGTTVPWQEAGALAIQQWEREGRGHPLRDAYDRMFSASDLPANFRRLRKQWGMKPDDWYVCLHTRDAGHYFEFSGTGQTHRNAPIETTLDAIRYITARGGWVIKLGGPNSPTLPQLERTIDYALSDFRSDLMDIHLIRHARAFVGTTSGLTNVAVSFGIPSAIVNAITTDAQLWHKDVRFAVKVVRMADGTAVSQRQLTSSPWRWRVFDAAVLGRHGAHPENNSAEEILGTVKEVEALARGQASEFETGYEVERLIAAWRRQLSIPHYYGASRPSLYFLKKHERHFLAESS
jgi:putative glycosyltransferase (TIGR04372 family)